MSQCVDVGAAAGEATIRLCEQGGAGTRLTAFEPFPGNHPHFTRETAALPNEINLIKKAVSDRAGTTSFVVPSIVDGSVPGWDNYEGYSSVGFIASTSRFKSLAYQLHGLLCKVVNRQRAHTLTVDTTTIDAEFPKATIDFMKIDVQGAEANVLEGARAALSEGRIHVLYIEWAGERDVLAKLQAHGYTLYDSTYVVCAKAYPDSIHEELGFRAVGEAKLSTGKTAQELVLTTAGLQPERALAELRKKVGGWMQTDLIAVSPSALDSFMDAVQKEDCNSVSCA